jgi:putative ABC transport system permease protein
VGRLPPISFTVRGDIESGDRLGRAALVHFDYLEDLLGVPGRASFIQARVAHPDLAPVIGRTIDDRFANFIVPTVTQSERSHVASVVASLSDVLRALRVIGYLTLAITVLVVGNSVAMSIRERTVEIGTLRAVGFGRRRVLGLVLGEAIAVSVLGGTAGAVAAWGCFELGWIQLPQRIGFRLMSDPSVVARAALLAVPVGALAGFQPAWSAVRMSITDALRWAE